MAWKALRPALIDDWRRAWRFASVKFNLLGLAVMGASETLGQTWEGLPPGIKDRLPHASTIAMVLFALGLIGRILKKADHDGAA